MASIFVLLLLMWVLLLLSQLSQLLLMLTMLRLVVTVLMTVLVTIRLTVSLFSTVIVKQDFLPWRNPATLRTPVLLAGHLSHFDEPAVEAGHFFQHPIVLLTFVKFRHKRAFPNFDAAVLLIGWN